MYKNVEIKKLTSKRFTEVKVEASCCRHNVNTFARFFQMLKLTINDEIPYQKNYLVNWQILI